MPSVLCDSMHEAASFWSSVLHHLIFLGLVAMAPSGYAPDTQTGYMFSSLLCLFAVLKRKDIHRQSANAKNYYSLRSILVVLSNYRGMY